MNFDFWVSGSEIEVMSNLRAICRPHTVFSSIVCCSRNQSRSIVRVSIKNVGFRNRNSNPSPSSSSWFMSKDSNLWFRVSQRRTLVRASSNWSEEKSPYDTLELDRDAEEEQIKVAYRRLAKFYHPDVYDGKGTLEEGETAEARFIKIQAAYELLMDSDKKRQYDMDNRVNPMKASQAWMEWLMKKRKAFDQRGDMAVAAWAEQQQLEINLRARRLSRSKVDPEEERKILEKEKKASREYFNSTLKRHTLVLKKRDLMRKKAEEDKRKLITQLLAAEGLELDTEEEEEEATKILMKIIIKRDDRCICELENIRDDALSLPQVKADHHSCTLASAPMAPATATSEKASKQLSVPM